MASFVKSNPELQRRVDAFVHDLEVLIRKAAIDAVASALGGGGARTGGGRAGGGQSGAAPAIQAGTAKATGAKRGRPAKAAGTAKAGKRVRRSLEQIDALAAKILQHVTQNPNQRAEAIKQALKIPAKEWALPVQKLISEGKLATKGERRATTYSAKR
jgi:hypothetical protein